MQAVALLGRNTFTYCLLAAIGSLVRWLIDSGDGLFCTDVQPGSGGKIRLMNLAPDTHDAGMSSGGKKLASNVAFSLGSDWAETTSGISTTFDFTDDSDAPPKPIGSVTAAVPAHPLGSTAYLIGMQVRGAP